MTAQFQLSGSYWITWEVNHWIVRCSTASKTLKTKAICLFKQLNSQAYHWYSLTLLKMFNYLIAYVLLLSVFFFLFKIVWIQHTFHVKLLISISPNIKRHFLYSQRSHFKLIINWMFVGWRIASLIEKKYYERLQWQPLQVHSYKSFP